MPLDEIFHTQMSVPPSPGRAKEEYTAGAIDDRGNLQVESSQRFQRERLHLNVLSQHADLEIKR